ncbi:MAG TPA: hypothetical protein VMV24_00820 [Candidatus Dormibacteraeota bacterium]|nr:hypothetical protein [Candidatus Dormibacteraeota bacterium]
MPPINSYQNTNDIYISHPPIETSFWKRKSSRIGIFLAIFLILILVILLILNHSKSPQNIAKQFVNATLNGQTSSAYKLTSSSFQTSSPISSWKADVQSINNTCGGAINLISSNTKFSLAEEIIKTSNSGNGSCLFRINLVYKNNKWEVNSMSFTN